MAKKEIVLPEGIEHLPVRILSSSDACFDGTVAVKRWTPAERRSRAFKRTGRLVGTIFACSLIGLFVHILLLVIIPGLLVTVLATAPLFMRFLNEEATFYYVEGTCPHCSRAGRLRPFLNTRLQPRMTLQCAECGQTSQVSLP